METKDGESAVTGGVSCRQQIRACVRGRAIRHRVDHPDRLQHTTLAQLHQA